jgi:hypothetical protein
LKTRRKAKRKKWKKKWKTGLIKKFQGKKNTKRILPECCQIKGQTLLSRGIRVSQ